MSPNCEWIANLSTNFSETEEFIRNLSTNLSETREKFGRNISKDCSETKFVNDFVFFIIYVEFVPALRKHGLSSFRKHHVSINHRNIKIPLFVRSASICSNGHFSERRCYYCIAAPPTTCFEVLLCCSLPLLLVSLNPALY